MLRSALPLTLALTACAAGRPAVQHAAPPTPATYRGVVRYEARHPTPHGASQDLERRPARFVEVVAEADDHRPLARTVTDAEGRFSLDAPAPATELAVYAHVLHDGGDLRVSGEADGVSTHALRVPRPDASHPLDLVAADATPGGIAGAFHIVDTALRGVDATRAWTGVTLPPLMVYWGRGVTTEWSYYRGERPVRSGRFCLELLGGGPGQQRSTDTDEHDEGIILHEFGHFVFDRLSSNSSTGGSHPGGFLIDPGLAWEEGRATWFSSAVRRDPHYRDTIGLEPGGSMRVDDDLERTPSGPRGIGSELTVSSVLWDLIDGRDGWDDEDHDGVAVDPAVVLRAMMAAHDDPAAYPALGTFLRQVSSGSAPVVTREALLAMLRATGEPATEHGANAVLPADDDGDWPSTLAVPGSAGGKIDGLSNPAPSGGGARPQNGLDALRVYRVQMPGRGWLGLELLLEGSGQPGDHTDIDLELRDHRGELVAASRGTGPRETLSRLVDAGYHYVYVRDAGTGNRASYTLRTRGRVLPAEPATVAPAARTR